MIKLRPHHLLCISHFEGKGYSEEFTSNMKHIVERLQNEDVFQITFVSDEICKFCPNLDEAECKTAAKVEEYDRKVATILKLKENETHSFKYITNKIKELTAEGKIDESVCKDCEWLSVCYK